MRQRKINMDQLQKWISEGKSQKEISHLFGVSDAAVSKAVKRLPPSLDGFTERERAFITEKANGANNLEAAKAAYDCANKDSAKAFGHQLMKREDIRTAIDGLMECQGLTRSYRVEKLKQHVDNKDPNVSLKALDMSFKLADEYPWQRHVIENREEIVYVVSFGEDPKQQQIIDLATDRAALPAQAQNQLPERTEANDES